MIFLSITIPLFTHSIIYWQNTPPLPLAKIHPVISNKEQHYGY
jgi:hypothetical protein